MNDERFFPAGAIVAACIWAWVVLLLCAAWASWLLGGPHNLPILLGLTACASSAAAATAHIRCYSVRLCTLIRVTGGLQCPDAEVREFGPRG